MGRCIIKLDGKYMEWTSVSDSPVTPLLTKEQFFRYWKEEYGRHHLWEFPREMARVDEKGTSSYILTADDILDWNRAGKNGAILSKEEIIRNLTCTPEEFLNWSQHRDMEAIGMMNDYGSKPPR